MDDLVQQVAASIRRERLPDWRQGWLVAVSGGLDSMVLLRVLYRLGGQGKGRLVVAHFNHRLRGEASDGDAQFVQEQARSLGLRFVGGSGEVEALAREQKISVEMAGRQLRHEFLVRTARAEGLRVIALGHHSDDQVELFFLRLLRGSGVEGLAGMKWRSPSPVDLGVCLVRPLLDQPRTVLETVAREEKVPFRNDASNASLEFQRNRIRHELLPLLQRDFQPALATVILRQMDLLAAEDECVSDVSDGWMLANGIIHRPRQPRAPDGPLGQLSSVPFDGLPVAVQRRVLHSQMLKLGFSPTFEYIERLRLTSCHPVTVDRRQVVFRDERGLLLARRSYSDAFHGEVMLLDLEDAARKAYFGCLELRWRLTGRGSNRPRNQVSGTEWFDASRVGTQVILRHWHPGDRFQPIGMPSPVKLQDFFTNLKVPRERRHQLVVAATVGGEIWWVEGLRIGERFKLTPRTDRRLKWQWSRSY